VRDESRRTDVPLTASQHFEKRNYPRAKGGAWTVCRNVNYPKKANDNVGDLHFLSVVPHLLQVVNPLRWRGSRTVVATVSEAQWLIMRWNAPEYSPGRVALRAGT
jgi:hypothetical protein